jgi:hypothetical protein
MNRQELISLAKQIYSTNDKVTRKLVRDFGVNDSEWEKEFGTWTEFLRQSEISYDRLSSRTNLQLARHVSVDSLRVFDKQKDGLDEKYVKFNDSRFQSILCGSDIHDKLCDPFFRRLFIETARRLEPNKIVLPGDIFDLYEFSRYTKDPRKMEIIEAIKWVGDFIKDLREASPNSEITIISGNHENRLFKHLADNSPIMLQLLGDYHGMSISSILGLDRYEVNYISKDSFTVFNESDLRKEIAKNYYVAYDTVLFHHFPYARSWGLAGVNGHHHKHLVSHHFSALRGPYEWHQLGAGHVRQAEYCEGELWQNGFCIIHVDTHKKQCQFEYIDCSYDMCVIGGNSYTRFDNEIVKI